jgi:quercetin dioxygenase-like cupin family protein
MNIVRASAIAKEPGDAGYFTGTVTIEQLTGKGTGRARVVRVSFAAGARTAWHKHPHGQIIHIISGSCRLQREGGEVTEVATGDTVWFEPGERHWHGATPGRGMVHLAVQMADESGRTVTWLEQVTDAEYPAPKGTPVAPAKSPAEIEGPWTELADPPVPEGSPVLTDEEKAAGFEVREVEHFGDLPEWEKTVRMRWPRFAGPPPANGFQVSVLKVLGESDAIFRVRDKGRRAYAHLRWGFGSAWSYATFYGGPAWHPVGAPVETAPQGGSAELYLKAENPGLTIQPAKFSSRSWAGD